MPYEKVENPDPDRSEMQQLWRDRIRERKGSHQIITNLTVDRIAILDVIAAELYRKHPHNPPRDLSGKFIGRQAAVEALIDMWFESCDDTQLNLVVEMMDKRKANSEFFRREATWRRCMNPKKGTKNEIFKPEPPWSGGENVINTLTRRFKMVSDSAPMDFDRWFPGYIEGTVFEASDEQDASDWLKMMCVAAGTHIDPFYSDLGPAAIEIFD